MKILIIEEEKDKRGPNGPKGPKHGPYGPYKWSYGHIEICATLGA